MNFLNEIELNLIPITVQMETTGFSINSFKVADIGERISLKTEAIEKEFNPVNLNSPKQVKELLISKGFSKDLVTYLVSGQAQSTNKNILRHLAKKTPIAKKILEYRELNKLLNTYITPMCSSIKWAGNYNQTGTMTGRYSSSKPNMQNIPTRTPLGKEIRSCLMAEYGYKLIISDLSQIEPRLYAFFSKDPKLQHIFNVGLDFHTAITRNIYGLMYSQEPTKEQRFVGKTVGLATLYGARTRRLQETLFNFGVDLPYIKANNIRNSIIKAFPAAWDWATKMNSNGSRMPYVETLLKRRIPVCPGMNIVNTLIQGSCADILKVCLYNVHQSEYTIIATVHDEIIVQVPEDYAIDDVESIKDLMQNSVVLKGIPIIADTKLADNWGEK